jgi:adenine specific DNA methylase Mod
MKKEIVWFRIQLIAMGRFHTDWLNMLYPRLKLAKDLLSDEWGNIY